MPGPGTLPPLAIPLRHLFSCFPGAGGVNRYSPPNWSLTMIRPLSSLHIATQDPCWGLGTEYSNSTLKPAGAEMFRTGVAESETD